MLVFRMLWGIDIMLALIAVFFFAVGIRDGTVSSLNLASWLLLLGGLGAVVLGSSALARGGRTRLAALLAALPAVPALFYGAFLAIALLTGARWN